MTLPRRSALLVVLLLSSMVPRPGLAQEELHPLWGAGVSVKAVPYTSFVPQDLFTVQNMASSTAGTGVVCDDVGGTCRFTASVDLPTGARIVGLELEACDNAPVGSVVAELYACPLHAPTCTTITSVTSVLCGTTASVPLNTTVQNAAAYYPLLVRITDDGVPVLFRAVRIRYQLQVSPPPATATFPNDVPTTHPIYRFVEALAAAGITGGCGAGAFCPDQPVTRGQMAVFLATALGLHFPN